MKKQVQVSFLACSIGLFCTHAALAASEQFNAGVAAYNSGDYQTAVRKLKEAVQAEPSNVRAHYYLAMTYTRMKNDQEALRQYQICYRANPKDEVGQYAAKAIRQLQFGSVGGGTANQGGGNVIKPPTNLIESNVKSDAEIINIRALPQIPNYHSNHTNEPTVQAVSSWGLYDRSGYMSVAAERVSTVETELDEARSLMKKARTVAASHVSSRRKYGESEDDFSERKRVEEQRLQNVLTPYRVAIEDRERALQEVRTILTICQQARDLVRSGVPPGIGY